MEDVKLKFCPFCGKAPRLHCQQFGMEKFNRYGVVCQGCGICIGWAMSEEEAAEKWNRRDSAHAHWTTKRDHSHDGEWYCSACGYEPLVFENAPYCAQCGARMEGWEIDEE